MNTGDKKRIMHPPKTQELKILSFILTPHLLLYKSICITAQKRLNSFFGRLSTLASILMIDYRKGVLGLVSLYIGAVFAKTRVNPSRTSSFTVVLYGKCGLTFYPPFDGVLSLLILLKIGCN